MIIPWRTERLKPNHISMLLNRRHVFLLLLLICFGTDALTAQEQFTFEDVMKFEDIKTPVISADGKWVAYGIWPEIGDGETLIRSEEHTSELQSRGHLVCRLLLEKKKQ